eukprot:1564491-Lingulodinium_polyedra.AAC.1
MPVRVKVGHPVPSAECEPVVPGRRPVPLELLHRLHERRLTVPRGDFIVFAPASPERAAEVVAMAARDLLN